MCHGRRPPRSAFARREAEDAAQALQQELRKLIEAELFLAQEEQGF